MAAVLYADDLFIYADRTVGNPVITVIAASWRLPRRRDCANRGDQAGSLWRCLHQQLVTIHVSFLKNLQHQAEERLPTNTTLLLANTYENQTLTISFMITLTFVGTPSRHGEGYLTL
jgi:hypothetical protein